MNVNITKTITSIFMVPTLKINRENLLDSGFINGYIKDGRKDVQYEGCIYLLFKPDNLDKFRDFLDGEYERTKQIIDDYDYEDGFVVVVYELNKKFKRDFEFVKNGKYSMTSEEFQKLFPKLVKIKKGGVNREEVSLQYRVFNKTEDLRQFWEDKLGVEFDEAMEVWHGFFEENEILNLDKIKEYVK
jgi:hypothetical protein